MKKDTNRKTFFSLLVASVVTTFMVLPYTIALNPVIAKYLTPTVLVAQVIQATIIFLICIFFGLKLSKKTGFGIILMEGKRPIQSLKKHIKISVGMGVLAGVLIILMSIPFGSVSTTFLQAEAAVATWKGFLASFYGGIAEEIVFRLFLLTLVVWMTTKIKTTKTGQPTNVGIWISIAITTVLFGLGHLGITAGLTTITVAVVLRAILLNGVSVMFAWLYWKKGLETAMIAHFSADIVIHVITPVVARWLL